MRQFYPGVKVNIVTHSMGGLLTRRYIMDHPDAKDSVNSVTTIAGPWLGGPKLPYVAETGTFITLPWYIPGGVTGADIKSAVGSMPSAAELGPSKGYYDLGGTPPIGEDGREWDVPPDTQLNETFDYAHQIRWLDARNPAYTPGTILDQFHELPVNGNYQDDWSHDTSGIPYFHLYGVQAHDATIGSVRATTWLACLTAASPVKCSTSEKINLRFTNGDGTVPALSAVRRTSSRDLNAPNAQVFPFLSPSTAADPQYEHTGLVNNPKVQDKIFEILGQQDDASRAAPAATPAPVPPAPLAPLAPFAGDAAGVKSSGGIATAPTSATSSASAAAEPAPLPREDRYITVDNATNVVVDDGAGHSTRPDATSFLGGVVPGVSIYPESDTSTVAIVPADGTYNTTFTTNGKPLEIEMRRGTGDTTTAVQRYVDVAVPTGVTAKLSSDATGTADLQLDENGDGTFETTIPPTASASGADAADTTPPSVTLTQAPATGGVQITLAATDAGAGVSHILYSLNGTDFLSYSAPFVVDPALVPSIVVIADDNIGNRSTPQTFAVQPASQPPVAVDGAATTPEDTSVTVTLSATDPAGAPLTYAVVTPPAHGTLLDIVGNQLTYQPAANFNGADSFTFTASNGTSTSTPATVSVSVSPVNDLPVAGSGSVSLLEDSPGVAVDLAGLVSDLETPVSGLSFVVVSGPAKGTLSGSGGSLIYTPSLNANGMDSFTYLVTDRGDPDGCSVLVAPCASPASSGVATVTLQIAPVNDPPVAVADAVTTAEDTSVSVPVLANDSDPDGDSLSVTAVGDPAHGTVSLAVDGTVAYTPAPDYNGPDSFTYTVSDGNGGSASASVAVDVTPVNDPPIARNDSATVLEDGSVLVDALANDSAGPANEAGQTLSFASVGVPLHGTVTVEAGKLRYTPAPDSNGLDAFTYTVSDGSLSAVATVSVVVVPVNDPPVAADDLATVAEDGATLIAVLANDTPGPSNEASQALDVSVITPPSHGLAVAVSFGPDAGKVSYQPGLDYNGPDSFTYLVCDDATAGGPPLCAMATVSVSVSPVNDLPVAGSGSVSLLEDSPGVAVDLAGLVSDLETPVSGLSFVVVSGPAKGTLSGSGGSLIYTPSLNANGMDSFTYLVTDRGDPDGCSVLVAPCASPASSGVATVTLQIAPVNDPPVAVADAVTTAEDTSVSVPVLANDSDPDGDSLSVTAVGDPAHGTVSLAVDGTVAYTPAPDYNGPDSFTYTVSDGNGGSASASVAVDVTPVNDPPIARNDSATVLEDGSVLVDALANDSAGPANEAGQTLSFASVGVPLHGTVTVEAGKLRYTPAPDSNGLDAFTYTVSDGSLSAVATVSVVVVPVNDPPVAADDLATVAEDGATLIAVLANDTPGPPNEAAQTLSLVAAGQPAHGSVSIEGDKVRYTPQPDYFGTDSFTYTTSDGELTASATVSVTVTEVNDPPVATPDAAVVAEDGSVLVDALANDTPGPANESGQTLVLAAVGAPAHGTTAIENGKLQYTPAADYNGADSFTYTVCDNGTTAGAPDGRCANSTVAITTTEVNDAPVVAAHAATVAEDGSVLVAVAAGDSPGPADESGQTLALTSTGGAAHGTVALENGKIRYTPSPDYNGSDLFTYTICDNGTTAGVSDPRCSTGMVDVTVTEVNDAPRAVDDAASVDEGGTVLIDALANDTAGPSNESGQTLAISAVSAPSHGAAAIEGGKLRYTPAAGYTGTDSFGYTACDNGTSGGTADPRCASAAVTVEVATGAFNHTPTAVDGSVSLNEDAAPVAIDLGALVSDVETAAANLTYTIVTPPSKGVLSGSGPVISYDSNPNANGSDSFTYTVTDRGRPDGCGVPGPACEASKTSAVRTVRISIAPVNDPPVVVLPSVAAAGEGGSTFLTASATDVDGDPVSYTWTTAVGTLVVSGATATVTVDDGPAAGLVRVTATDPSGATGSAELRLDVPNVPPTATFTSDATVQEGQSFHLSLLNPSDPSAADRAAGFTYAFDCGDGSGFGAYGVTATATCVTSAAATRSVGARVRDKDGGVSAYSGSVVVSSLPPVATFSNDGPVDESQPFHLSVAVTPAAKAASFDYAFDCGGGLGFAAFAGLPTRACPTDDNGTRAVRARLRARDGSIYDYVGSVVVRNLPPVANAGADASVYWGIAAPFIGLVSDPSVADQTAGLAPTWTWGDGTLLSYGIAPTHSYATPGTYTATLKATDKDGASSVDTAVVTVMKRGTTVTYTGSVTTVFGYATLSASLVDSVDPSTAQLAGKTLIFSVGTQVYTAKTDALGAAVVVLTAPIPAGTYAVTARFAADTRYLASSSATATLKIGSSAGSATGTVLVPVSGGSASFTLTCDGITTRGTLDYASGTMIVHATTLAPFGIAADGRSAWFSGLSASGQQLRVYVEDNGPGATDVFRLWVNGVLQTGTGALAAGNVQIVRLS